MAPCVGCGSTCNRGARNPSHCSRAGVRKKCGPTFRQCGARSGATTHPEVARDEYRARCCLVRTPHSPQLPRQARRDRRLAPVRAGDARHEYHGFPRPSAGQGPGLLGSASSQRASIDSRHIASRASANLAGFAVMRGVTLLSGAVTALVSALACREPARQPVQESSAFAAADSLRLEGRAAAATPRYLALRDSFSVLRDTASRWRAELWLAY